MPADPVSSEEQNVVYVKRDGMNICISGHAVYSRNVTVEDACEYNFWDSIVVLGGGRPSSHKLPPRWVQARCDAAAQVYFAYKNKGKNINILSLGGGSAHAPQLLNGRQLPVWESVASAVYLVEKYKINPLEILFETSR